MSRAVSFRMSLKKAVFRCTCVYDDRTKEGKSVEIDAKRINNTVTLSLVITNQTPEKGTSFDEEAYILYIVYTAM